MSFQFELDKPLATIGVTFRSATLIPGKSFVRWPLASLCRTNSKINAPLFRPTLMECPGPRCGFQPPGGALSKFEEDQVDLQVMRRHDATAHELRTGDAGPGSIPLPEISPILAAPSSARYQLVQSQSRLGINTGSSKGGLAIMSAFGDLTKQLPTPFIIDSSLGPVYMTFQTPFMDSILHEAFETWILDFTDGPEASRHGIVVDGDHTFFRQGPLLTSCVLSRVSAEWTPILYSWINGLDKAHHRPHFAHLFKSIIKHAGDRFTRKPLLCVMDFPGAQRGHHAEEYADAVISTMPHFSQLSPEAQDAERRALIREAEEAEVGCEVHFWRSADRVRQTHSLIPPESAPLFERFDELILTMKTTFPKIKPWLSWWERRPIASMIFPAKSSVDPKLAAKAPSTTNPIEHQHSLLHHAVGKDQELLPGIEKLFLHVREMENKYNAIKDGHFDASEARNRRPPKPPVYGENDGRPPDTIAALAAATATGVEPSPALVHAAPNPPINYSPRLLQFFKWESSNSCFFDRFRDEHGRSTAFSDCPFRDGGLSFGSLGPYPEQKHRSPNISLIARHEISGAMRQLLQINPDTGAQPRLALTRTFTVSDYQGVVTYELVGTVLFHVAEKHYTSKIVIKDTAFDYDGMGSGGALVPVGPADLICRNDPRATSRAFNEVVSTYTKALTIYSAIPPPSPGSTLVNTPPASPAAPAEEINPGPLAMFLFNGMPPDSAQFPELPPPSEWCGGCRQIAVAGDNTVLQCTPIPSWISSMSTNFAALPACRALTMGKRFGAMICITSTGTVRVEWYKDNIYEQTDKPAETDFVCSKQECADTAAREPEGKYDRTNVGAIKWPPRSTTTAIPKSPAHFPMLTKAPQAKEVKHAKALIQKFSSAAILAGDASFYESHIAEVIAECLPRTQEVSESIYFLARRFSPGEYIAADDPLAAAKRGIVVRHLTIPETVLQVPETSAGLESMPCEFCKIRTFIRKAAAARISPGFCLATAYKSDKQEYDWSLTGSSADFNGVELPPISFLPQDSPTNQSSPLSDPPPSDVEPDLGSDNKPPGGRKREREEDSGGETEPAPRRLKDVTPALALRRSNRRQVPPHQ
ncbi:hypothetical protein DFH08DRAFT_823369 [Mycena albidolilacea]|uniref:Uncharacterized protein n=1 Tax=Mycena albidolilacea TaxID=1033008 RepID=A0AAD7EC32_9AGAR|nr:hypothetical protein DFH08DRAFT_823369 [Mycena albidolilacea]